MTWAPRRGLEIAFAQTSHVPGLGASGAIAGVLGAFLLLFPTSSVRAVLPITILLIPVRLPAWVLIGGWFLIQLSDGLTSLSPGSAASASGVAYWAHVGGFLFGVLVALPARLREKTPAAAPGPGRRPFYYGYDQEWPFA